MSQQVRIEATGDEEFEVVNVMYPHQKGTKAALLNKATRRLVGLEKGSVFHVSKPTLQGMLEHKGGAFKRGAIFYELGCAMVDSDNYCTLNTHS
ncbi:hypothetical protein VCHA53O466_50378 [Vibrio chagasii]|nr:hypothetical protein VCHA53O466_50378 [Vibrio chagasii]